jgi:hypothetical protein
LASAQRAHSRVLSISAAFTSRTVLGMLGS